MQSFHWDKNFETGLSDVDQQHHHLLDIVNEFGDMLTENKIVSNDIERIFKQLFDYARYHFQQEEALMLEYAVDQRHFNLQIEAHHYFLHEVRSMYSVVSEDDLDSAKNLLDFLTHWLAYHILGADQNMASQIAAIKAGIKPEQAYEAEEKQADRATEPLLIALNGLFQQLSVRNRALTQLTQSLEEKVALRTRELHEANLHLEEISLTDALTGLPNRRHAMRRFATLWEESIESNLPLVCIMIDADHFKQVNDNHGHDSGDAVLSELAKTLQHSVRTDDVVCRIGGDEFIILCPNTDKHGGLCVAELTREAVAKLRVPTGGESWYGSISVGVAARTSSMQHFEELILAADRAVYSAKQHGKNCVRVIS